MGRARGPPHLHRTSGVDVDDAAVEASGVTGDTPEAKLQAACDTLSSRQQPRIRRAGTRSPARAGVRTVSRSESGLVRTRGRRGHEAPAFARATKKRQGVARPSASRDESLSATDVIASGGAYARLGTVGGLACCWAPLSWLARPGGRGARRVAGLQRSPAVSCPTTNGSAGSGGPEASGTRSAVRSV